jgi:progesterone-induced-blocking factor 1
LEAQHINKHLAELTLLKEAHEKELQLHKQNLAEVYEKKIEYLREAKEESEMRLARVERDLLEKATSYDEILLEFRKMQARTDEAVGGVSHELRYKSDELVRITHLYEDNLSLVKEYKLENVTLKEKMDLIKNDYYRLEANERQKNADALAQVAVYKERLAHYEAIEKELDDAIISVAENDERTEVGDIVLNAVRAAPTASNRRVQQSLLLANRLQAKQKEVEKLKLEVKDLKNKMRNMTDDSQMYRKLADKANQPYSYLMADIEKGEKDLNMAFKRLRTKEDEINELKEENKALKIAVNTLQEDLYKLTNKRKQLDNLQSTLMGIVKGSTTKKISVDFLKTKLSESNRENKFKEEADGLSFLKLTGLGKTTNAAFNKQKNASKSKTPKKYKNLDVDDDMRTTSKKGENEVPAWYNALKSNLK